jgi:hypothetical protein
MVLTLLGKLHTQQVCKAYRALKVYRVSKALKVIKVCRVSKV